MTNYSTDKSFALEMDAEDPLAKYRDQFHIPKQNNGENCIYFCGNSLGLQPKTAKAYVDQELDAADEVDLAYGETLRRVTAAGVEALAYRMRFTPRRIELVDRLPIDL